MNFRPKGADYDRCLRRAAARLLSELPDDRSDALKVLDYARDLVAGFIHADNNRELLRLVSSKETV